MIKQYSAMKRVTVLFCLCTVLFSGTAAKSFRAFASENVLTASPTILSIIQSIHEQGIRATDEKQRRQISITGLMEAYSQKGEWKQWTIGDKAAWESLMYEYGFRSKEKLPLMYSIPQNDPISMEQAVELADAVLLNSFHFTAKMMAEVSHTIDYIVRLLYEDASYWVVSYTLPTKGEGITYEKN